MNGTPEKPKDLQEAIAKLKEYLEFIPNGMNIEFDAYGRAFEEIVDWIETGKLPPSIPSEDAVYEATHPVIRPPDVELADELDDAPDDDFFDGDEDD